MDGRPGLLNPYKFSLVRFVVVRGFWVGQRLVAPLSLKKIGKKGLGWQLKGYGIWTPGPFKKYLIFVCHTFRYGL